MDLHPSTHPPLPPTTEDARLAWLRLLRSRRIGISSFYRLMAEHGSAEAALDHLPEIARAAGVEKYSPCPMSVAEQELARGHRNGAHLLFVGGPGYPKQLLDLNDPPPMLWVLGRPELLNAQMIAVVGARAASSLGLRMAKALARDLGDAGYVVVSGLARGVDAEAHEAALRSGTVAVQAGGVDTIYPKENADLSARIARNGLRISEQPMGFAPAARHFPARNRLVAGLSRAVVVIEAAGRSGSLITARTALDQGRDVMAVPGHPFDPRAAGCNMLIRDGAVLVRNASDVIEALGPEQYSLPEPRPPARRAPQPAPQKPAEVPPEAALERSLALHAQILEKLGPYPLQEDELIRNVAVPASTLTPVLTDLELEGRIERQPGGFIAVVP
ncbi:DNA-processing protein DprA [Pseudooceanicola sp. HF7]|uniref:DNA-processing protein DprA n=1 Tax=Pseudooceanicola sp. HF7 TaxID=2721560 RepID=UPI0014314F8E|nr:DNA-protecting protein DprA [Pseudooceanicola sp. HF7]